MGTYILTGATGFIGSNLVKQLVLLNHDVHVVVRPTSSYHYLGETINNVHIFSYDGNLKQLIDYFKEVKPDVTIHLASLFLSDHNEDNLNQLLNSNIVFGTEILEAMRQAGCKKIINTGTYWQHFNNEDYNPVCLYAATKQAFSDLIYYYCEAYEMQSITLELFDTFGLGDERGKILNLLKKHLGETTLLSVSPGEQLMDFVYIDDVVNAYLRTIELFEEDKSLKFETYSISSGERYTLKQIVKIIDALTKKPLVLNWGGRGYRYREILTPYSDGKVLPGWAPKITVLEGLKRFFEVK